MSELSNLPKIADLPSKEITLPVTKQKVKIRPFLVKEEKVLLMIKEDTDASIDDFIEGMNNIIDACTMKTLKFEETPPADLEYLFLQIRMLSKGSKSDFRYRCKAMVEENGERKECNGNVEATVDLNTADVKSNEGHTNQFQIPGTEVYIFMKHPTVETSKTMHDAIEGTRPTYQNFEDLILSHIDYVIDASESKDDPKTYTQFTKKELGEWVENNVPSSVVEDIIFKFFHGAPTLQLEFDLKCPKCGNEEHVTIRGIENFFGSA